MPIFEKSRSIKRNMRGVNYDIFRMQGTTDEHQMDYEWVCVLPPLGTSGALVDNKYVKFLPPETRKILTSNEEPSDISRRIYQAMVPVRSIEADSSPFKNRSINVATSSSLSDMRLTIDEHADGATLQYISAWQNLIYNEDGTQNPPSIYKRDIIVYQTRNNGEVSHIILFENAFPTEVTPLELSYDGTSILQYEVSFAGDKSSVNIKTAYDQIRNTILTHDYAGQLYNRAKAAAKRNF